MSQFELTHGHEPYVVMIDVGDEGHHHVWSAKDREQAERWVDFWRSRGATAEMLTMQKYGEMQVKSDS